MVIPDVHVVIEVFLAVNGKVVKKGTSSAVVVVSILIVRKKTRLELKLMKCLLIHIYFYSGCGFISLDYLTVCVNITLEL